MENQPNIISSLTKDQLSALSNNLVEAMQVLYRSVVTRNIKAEVEKIKNEKPMQNGEKKYGEITTI